MKNEISKIKIVNQEYNIKDEELCKALNTLLGGDTENNSSDGKSQN